MPPSRPTVQTCRGELNAHAYGFRCDPLSVVVTVTTNVSGDCSISSMVAANGLDSELRVPVLGHLIDPAVPVSPSARPKNCGELPLSPGQFEIKVQPRAGRAVDKGLSAHSLEVVSGYFRAQFGLPCILRLPNIRQGDPFVHVYEECLGVLGSVWEFPIRHNQVEEFAQWTYQRRQNNLPPGVEWRRKSRALWFWVGQLPPRVEREKE